MVHMLDFINSLGKETSSDLQPGTSRGIAVERGFLRRGSDQGFEFKTVPIVTNGAEVISVNVPVDKFAPPIPDRYEDPGEWNREIIIFDKVKDQNWKEYAQFGSSVGNELRMGTITEEEALDRIFRFARRGKLIPKTPDAIDTWKGEKVYLGSVLQASKGECRHTSLAIKGMLDEAGMSDSFQQKGRVYDDDDPEEYVNHAWVEYRMKDGRWALMDASNQRRVIYSTETSEMDRIRDEYKTKELPTPTIKISGKGIDTKDVFASSVICSDYVRVRTSITDRSQTAFSISGKVGILPPKVPIAAHIFPKSKGVLDYRLSYLR
jgi:hypothetical protein